MGETNRKEYYAAVYDKHGNKVILDSPNDFMQFASDMLLDIQRDRHTATDHSVDARKVRMMSVYYKLDDVVRAARMIPADDDVHIQGFSPKGTAWGLVADIAQEIMVGAKGIEMHLQQANEARGKWELYSAEFADN